MKRAEDREVKSELALLCDIIRELAENCEYEKGVVMIQDAMGRYPHAPEPHNLLGVLLEQQGDHVMAMKHFRAAWALDPTYIPTRCNLERMGGLFGKFQCAFDEKDCPEEKEKSYYRGEHENRGIVRMFRGA